MDTLRAPRFRWVRIPLGVILVIASVLWVLPVFGLWMLPLGLLLLAVDLPALRPFVSATIIRLRNARRRARHRNRDARRNRGDRDPEK